VQLELNLVLRGVVMNNLQTYIRFIASKAREARKQAETCNPKLAAGYYKQYDQCVSTIRMLNKTKP
jgi:hypothetical protein